MEAFESIVAIDEHLLNISKSLGPVTYLVLFIIVFAETGLVIAPFLPGDSLLFLAGTVAGGGYLNIWILYFTLFIAAILGDTVNYWLGSYFGKRAFAKKNSRIFKIEYLEKTRIYYELHGGKTIIIARFLPIVRTFAPFVAGIGKMNYPKFFYYNVLGAFIWVTSLVFAGYFLGQLEIVKNNFELTLIIFIIIFLIPVVYESHKHKKLVTRDGGYEKLKKTFEEERLDQ